MSEKYNLLDAIPVPADQILTEWKGEYIVLAFPRFKQRWMQKYLVPKSISPYIRVTLEEHGTAIWQLIDGKRSVAEIIETLTSKTDTEKDYVSRIATYIMQLQKDKFIRLVLPN